MANWFIRQDKQLYLYSRQGLHQLKTTPENARRLIDLMFGDSSANSRPIDEAAAERLLPKAMRPVPTGRKPESGAAVSGEWLLRVMNSEQALLLRNLEPDDEPEIMAFLEDGNPHWRSAAAPPLLASYAGRIAAACEGLQEEDSPAAKRVIQIDISGAKKIVEPKILLADILREAVRAEQTGSADSAEVVDWIGCLDALERLEKQLVHKFIFRSNRLLQVPYKVATAEGGDFFCGEGNAEQIVRASCRNLERLLARVLPGASGWVVAAGKEHLMERQAEQLFKLREAAGMMPPLECREYTFAELPWKKRIHAMIERFVPAASRLEVYVERIPGVEAYRAAAGAAGNTWTPGCYASSLQQAVHSALIRFYALVQQNSIRCGNPHDAAAEQIGSAQLEVPGQELTAAFMEEYLSFELLLPVLQNTGISVLQLQRREEQQNEGNSIIPDGRFTFAGGDF